MHNVTTCKCLDCELAYIRVEAAEHERNLETAIDDFIREMAEEEIPLSASVTVAAVLSDICALANIPVPLAVLSALDHVRV
jgi:hypothetical protein